jgi:hypothetical protein
MSPNAELIRIPFAGMMLLTLVVWIVMFRRRIGAIRTLGLNPTTRADLEAFPAPAVNASNNLQNLFELPVIFYAVVLALLQMQVTRLDVVCAFGFFVFRIAHSTIHCTYNHIMQRFTVYAIASTFLWIMVIHFAFVVVGQLG